MSVEQVEGRIGDVRPQSDIYSLGVILYELLTGELPFRGSVTAILGQILTQTALPQSQLRKNVDPALESICLKMMAKSAGDRQADMKEVTKDLTAFLRKDTAQPVSLTADANADTIDFSTDRKPSGPVLKSPVSRRRPTKKTKKKKKSKKKQKAGQPSPVATWMSRHRKIVGSGGLAVVLLAAVVFYVMTNNGAIRVEINDPDIEVAIKGTEIVLKQADKGKDIKLSAGNHTFIVQWGKVKFETDKLILKRGENITVRVELLAGEIQVRQGKRLIGQRKLPLGATGSGTAPPLAVSPFDEKQAKAHQQAWAKYLGVPVEKDVDIGGGIKIKMVLIPPGEFLMGSTDEERARWLKDAMAFKADEESIKRIPSAGPQHRVRFTKPFYLAVHEVTQELYQQVTGANPSAFSNSGVRKDNVAGQPTHSHPIETVSWFDAVSFCNKLSVLQKRRPCYVISGRSITLVPGNGYRLPSEAEWEYACRAGSTGKFGFSDENELGNYAWYGQNSRGVTHPVGEKQPNVFGAYDMHGNVLEWCWDWYDVRYYEKLNRVGVLDPIGPATGSLRVTRGGGWGHGHRQGLCRSAGRNPNNPFIGNAATGFRLAMTIDAAKALPTRKAAEAAKPAETKPYQWPADAPAPAIAPFDAKQAKAHQEAWAKYIGTEVETTNNIGMKFRVIPPGEFLMGCSDEEITKLLEEAKERKHADSAIDWFLGEGPQTQSDADETVRNGHPRSNPRAISSICGCHGLQDRCRERWEGWLRLSRW